MVKLISAILSLSMLFGTGAVPSSNVNTVTANVPVTVGKQQAVYEKYICDITKKTTYIGLSMVESRSTFSTTETIYKSYEINKDTGEVFLVDPYTIGETIPKGTYFLFYGNRTGSWNGISGLVQTTVDLVVDGNVSGWILNIAPQTRKEDIYYQGTYIENVTADNGSLPVDGKRSDGFWYVFKNLVED